MTHRDEKKDTRTKGTGAGATSAGAGHDCNGRGIVRPERDGVLAGKRKSGEEQAHQPVRHSLWEQDSLEAHNELLFGCFDGEVEALQQSKAQYDEARRRSDGSDSCWSCSDNDSCNEVVPEVGIGPPTLEGAVVDSVVPTRLDAGRV